MSTPAPSNTALEPRSHLPRVAGVSQIEGQPPEYREDLSLDAPGQPLAHVLVVGDECCGPSQMVTELRDLLPAGTPFVEAHETWEVLARVEGSRMVVLTGDLGDVSAASIVRLLSRRHPQLPLVSVSATRTHAAPSGDVGAVSS
jgi:hypothetical protein